MAAGKVVAIVVVLVLFFMFVPIFPFTFASVSIFGFNASVSANASLTFILLRCGSFVNAHVSASFLGVGGSYPVNSGYQFTCNFGSN